MSTQQLHRPPGDDVRTARDRPPAATTVVETVSSGRLIALLLAAVGLSILTSLVVGGGVGDDETSTVVQEVGQGAEPGASVDVEPALGASAVAPDAEVVPDLVPRADLALAPSDEVNVATAPEMPPPVGRTSPAIVDVVFDVVEQVSTIDPATGEQFETWGYRIPDGQDGIVVGTPGPVIRARVGDVLRFTITNPAGNTHPHNVDLHAVTGQGGGAAATTVAPGETATMEARLLYPGFFMYHCAYGDVPSHISHGMFGGILVEPETPLPTVDHEWYLVQSEYYTTSGEDDVLVEDRAALSAEAPTHVVFNGAVGSLTDERALQMAVGERARVHLVNAGLNLASNFHPIGSHWDTVYQEAALLNAPLRGSQTTLVPAGGATVVELLGQVPQTVVLVDHALARAFDKGAIAHIVIAGAAAPEIFDDAPGDLGATAEAPATTVSPARESGGPEPASSAPAATGAQFSVSIEPGSGRFREVAPDDYSEAALAGYGPSVQAVSVGDTVTWTNDDTTVHTVTAADGSFDSGNILPGDSWSHTFSDPGDVNYFCTPHPWMRGRIAVS